MRMLLQAFAGELDHDWGGLARVPGLVTLQPRIICTVMSLTAAVQAWPTAKAFRLVRFWLEHDLSHVYQISSALQRCTNIKIYFVPWRAI